ncbi:MAG: efflux RND transporter periplasmic adaptor subunit [Xanthobacteraceae bacterium]|nr:efflux RND transporter periplasmic adaptor subunit [Xanthobacteraceae bacterium]
MAKSLTVIACVVSVAAVATAVAVVSPDRIDLRGAIAQTGDKFTDRLSEKGPDRPSDKPSSERRWLAVAPGRVEPPSGMIKVAAPAVGIVSKVLVKVNDTVFAGEPLILLNDDEIQSRYAAAEAQAGMRKRLRDEQPATGKAADRRKAEDAVADAETAMFDAQMAVDRAAITWRSGGGSNEALTNARSALARAQDDLSKRQAQLRAGAADAPLPTPLEAQVASARGDLAFARANLEKLRIRAPIDGTVLQININPGELATPNSPQPLLMVANLMTLNVRAELDERDVSEIKVGQVASIRAAAFPNKEFAGSVTSIAPLVEPSRIGGRAQQGSRSDIDAIEVLIKLQQPGPLTAGMKVDVYFNADKQASR